MIAAVDVQYDRDRARAACVVFKGWSASVPEQELTCDIDDVAEYVPGQFYLREMPCIQEVVSPVLKGLEVLLIDGYVYLDENNAPGLGAYLYEALGGVVPIVGVAKSSFKGSAHAREVFRNRSRRPLFVTAIGMDSAEAADRIRSMAGPHRLPTMIKRVDKLCRS